jgi:multiple sugar transport system permease protein
MIDNLSRARINAVPVGRKKRRPMRRSVKETITGYLFITPYLIGFLIFQGIPFLMAFVLGFTNIKLISKLAGSKFIGFQNFIRMFNDWEVMSALGRSGLYSLIYVPLIMIMGFAFAYLINQKIYARNLIRTMIFLPYVSNIMAVAVIFKLLLNPNGPILGTLKAMTGVAVNSPLYSLTWALPIVVFISVWSGMGLNMITFLAALQNVPKELLEAAEIDGATRWDKIRSVIIPVITPTSFFLLISSIITSLQNFTIIQAMTKGGPGQATTVLSVSIVETAFTKYDTAYASTQAIVLFIIVMIVTLIQWRGQNKWVNY